MDAKSMSFLAIALGLGGLANAQAVNPAGDHFIAHNTPPFITTARNMGPSDPAKTIDIAVWLKPHNRAELDTLTEELYDPSSSHYRDWLKPAEIVSRFAPTAEEAQAVGKFLSSHNLPVAGIGPDNFMVRARGTVADVQKAFHVQIDNFELNGKIYRANTTDPSVDDPAISLVGSVSGLDNLQYQHPNLPAAIPKKSSSHGYQAAVASDAGSTFFTSNCFTGVKTDTYSGIDENGYSVTAAYHGNTYNASENTAGCGYTPPEIWTAYNLTGLYKEGFDGTGQTIVIIDWCGSPTIEADANVFSERFGLPLLNKSNFHIYYSGARPTCGGPDVEINIDVEWAHAIAPGAKIALVVPPTPAFMDVDDAELYALANGLGNIISGSYGSEEAFTPPAVLNEENLINQLAAVLGVSANFSTGDSGDFTFDVPSTYNPPSVIAPADSPYATAVGGVSLALQSNHTIRWQTGWGTNQTALAEFGTVFDPPAIFGFYGGSGGGPSAVYSKPSFQHKLPGTQRLLPDISWLADPFTGGVIAITEPGVFPTEWQVWGGTSLSCPMFSGLWAIANQEAGTPLGQAARHLYSMPAGSIRDVLPLSPSTDVNGTIVDSLFGTSTYTADQVAGPLGNTTTYYSAIWNVPLEPETAVVLTFGTDSFLTITPGWDDVTGLGTPNGKPFADYFNPAHK